MSAPALAGENLEFKPYVSGHYPIINMRSGPSIDGNIIHRIDTGTLETVEYLGQEKDGWVLVRHEHYNLDGKPNNIDGWVLGDFVGLNKDKPYKPFDKPQEYVFVKDRGLQRVGPSFRHEVSGLYRGETKVMDDFDGTHSNHIGDLVTIVGKQGHWLRTDKNTWLYQELVAPKK